MDTNRLYIELIQELYDKLSEEDQAEVLQVLIARKKEGGDVPLKA